MKTFLIKILTIGSLLLNVLPIFSQEVNPYRRADSQNPLDPGNPVEPAKTFTMNKGDTAMVTLHYVMGGHGTGGECWITLNETARMNFTGTGFKYNKGWGDLLGYGIQSILLKLVQETNDTVISQGIVTKELDIKVDGSTLGLTKNTDTIPVLYPGRYRLEFNGIEKSGGTIILLSSKKEITSCDITLRFEATEITLNPYPISYPDIHDADTSPSRTFEGSTDKNYVATFVSRSFQANEGDLTFNYYDGFGRKDEIVRNRYSPDGFDVTEWQEYDGLGREGRKWLPVETGNEQSGTYKSKTSLASLAPSSNAFDGAAYSYPVYESTPLNRVVENYGEGLLWHRNGKSVKTEYMSNISGNDSLNCKILNITNPNTEKIGLTVTGNYPTGSLLATYTRDEDGNSTIEFKDRQGNIVLERRILHKNKKNENIDTYYVYAGLNRLYAVLPPMLSARMGAGVVEQKEIAHYAYLYIYDAHGWIVGKKLPGASWIRMTYNGDGTLCTMQDGKQRKAGECTFYAYDSNGNLCITGVWAGEYPDFKRTITCTYKGKRGKYLGYDLNNVALKDGNEIQVMQIHYYDNYKFLEDLDGASRLNKKYASLYHQAMRTGTAKRRMYEEGEVFDFETFLYDNRNRISHKEKTNAMNGIDRYDYRYNFIGDVTSYRHVHTVPGHGAIVETYDYTYDHAGRLLSTRYRLGNGPYVQLQTRTYNQRGLLKECVLGNGLTLKYHYNVRGWMRSIDSELMSQTIICEENKAKNIPSYKGNVSMMNYKVDGLTRSFQYSYDNLSRIVSAHYYDDLSEGLYSASYAYDLNGNMLELVRNGSHDGIHEEVYNEISLEYSGNHFCNIAQSNRHVPRKGDPDASDIPAIPGTGTIPFSSIVYDENGNLTQYNGKQIVYDRWNNPQMVDFLNNGNAICYGYNAAGEKMRVIYLSNPFIINPLSSSFQEGPLISDRLFMRDTITYCDNVMYYNGKLTMILNDVGYATMNKEKLFSYFYHIKDHQGNVRVVADETGREVQTNHFYPFGALMSPSTNEAVQPFKYNGKEYDRMFGLDWYDYGSRYYEPAIARWLTMDPQCEKAYGTSPYAYCNNNPVSAIDPDGEEIIILYRDKNGAERSFKFSGAIERNFANIPDNQYVKDVINAYLYNTRNGGGDYLRKAITNPRYSIKVAHPITNPTNKERNIKTKESKYEPKENLVYWLNDFGIVTSDGDFISPATILEHEMYHAVSYEDNPMDRFSILSKWGRYVLEKSAINNAEHKTAKANKEATRKDHEGKFYRTNGPTTTDFYGNY